MFPTLYFLIGGLWTEMKPNDYIIDSSIDKDRSVCTLGIVPNTEDYWLLGDTFLRGYYSVFNMDSGQLGLVPHVDSDKVELVSGISPSKDLNNDRSIFTWTVTAAVVALVTYLFITYI